MQRSGIARWAFLLPVVALLAGAGHSAAAEEVLLPPRPHGGGGTLAELGELQLGRLPWQPLIVRANLSADRPVAIVGAFYTRDDVLCVTTRGVVYCLSRRDLTPRWVSSLKGPLAQPPCDGPTHYAFIVQNYDGSYWLHAFAKRNGDEGDGFPVRLPFAVSSGCSANGSFVFVGSLGSVGDAKTVVAYSLADGRPSWGHRTRALVWATPTVDPSGNLLVVSGENGVTEAIDVGGANLGRVAWTLPGTGPISASPAVVPGNVVIASQDGVLRGVDLGSGRVNWLQGLQAPIEKRPWVLGSMVREKRASGVEGAAEIEVERFAGIAFARTRAGLHAFDLDLGTPLFQEPRMSRPVLRHGRYVLTVDLERRVLVRDAQDGYKVKGTLDLAMFDLIPTNETNGQLVGITSDGMVVSATPR